jgi:hypothetical protein
MYSSRMGYLSPLLSPSTAASAAPLATPLHGLGLSNCHLLPEANEDLLNLSPYVGSPSRRHLLENQAGRSHNGISTEQNLSASNPATFNLTSATINSSLHCLVQGSKTAAAAHPTNASHLEYLYSSAAGPFSASSHGTASAPDYQARSYMTTNPRMADLRYPWGDLEPRDGYLTPNPFSSYSTPIRVESPTMSKTVFAASAPESPIIAANPQSAARRDSYLGFDLVADNTQSQHRGKGHRAFSWPGDCSSFEQSQELDAWMRTQRTGKDPASSRHSYRRRGKNSRVARSRQHRTSGAGVRVTCSYGSGCRQTFNRKTDLDRHINTVRRIEDHFQTIPDLL